MLLHRATDGFESVVRMRFLMGLSVEEVAQALGMPGNSEGEDAPRALANGGKKSFLMLSIVLLISSLRKLSDSYWPPSDLADGVFRRLGPALRFPLMARLTGSPKPGNTCVSAWDLNYSAVSHAANVALP